MKTTTFQGQNINMKGKIRLAKKEIMSKQKIV